MASPVLQASAVPGQVSTDGTHGRRAIVQMGGPSIAQRRGKKEDGNADNGTLPQADNRFLTKLANHAEEAWTRNRQAKFTVERDMLKSARQRQRQYEADVLAAIKEQGGSDYYDGITPTKCRAAQSWIEDTLLPTGDRIFDCKPTAVPDISPEIRLEIEQRVMHSVALEFAQARAAGVDVAHDPSVAAEIMDMVHKRVEQIYEQVAEEEADKKAKKMAKKIDDQFQEGNFYTEFRALINDFVTFPAALMMGPIFVRRRRLKYIQQAGDWIPQIVPQVIQEFQRVSPYDAYPEDDSTGVDDGDLFIRKRISSQALASFKGVPGYDTEAIDCVLDQYTGGFRNWTNIDQARAYAEGRQGFLYQSTKLDMLRFFGAVQGRWLLEHVQERGLKLNASEIDPLDYYEVDCIKIGPYIIRAVLNPNKLGHRPLSKACYEEIPGAFWGHSIPDLLRHDQNACNATARAICNNTALSSGPISEWNTDRLPNPEDRRLVPWMSIDATDDQFQTGTPAVRFTDVPNNTDEMLRVWDHFQRQADEHSGVPAYAHGDSQVGGAGNTASGLSMLMSSSSKLLRMAIYHLDAGIVEPTVRRQYQYNMLFLKDPSYKGDLQIVPKGAKVLMIREMMAARRGEFADSTNNPIDYQLMGPEGRRNLRRAQARDLDFDADSLYPDRSAGTGDQGPGLPGGAGGGQPALPGPQQQPAPQQGGVNQAGAGGVAPGQRSTGTDAGGRPVRDYQKQ